MPVVSCIFLSLLLCINLGAALELNRGRHRAMSKAASTEVDKVDALESDSHCRSDFALNIGPSTLIHNNLGGLGPGTGQHALIFGDVAPLTGSIVDLVIRNTSEYMPRDPKANGAKFGFGKIVLKVGTSVDLHFSLVDRETGQTASVGPFFISFLDLDLTQQGGEEAITMSGFHSYNLSDETEIAVTNNTDGRSTFTATLSGNSTDNPRHPLNLTKFELDRTVTFGFPDVASFDVTLRAGGNFGGRPFLFAGASSLVCPPKALCTSYACPVEYVLRKDAESVACGGSVCGLADAATCCLPKDDAFFGFRDSDLVRSQLGNTNVHGWQGLGTGKEGLLYSNIYQCSDAFADMLINAKGNYTPFKGYKTGLNGDFGIINVAAGTSVDMEVTFYDQYKDKVVEMPAFHMTFFDLDQQANGDGVEAITVSGFNSYNLSSNTAVTAEDLPEAAAIKTAVFTSTVYGADDDNPAEFIALDVETLKKAVTLRFPATSKFSISFSAGAGWAGRNILFSKPSPEETC